MYTCHLKYKNGKILQTGMKPCDLESLLARIRSRLFTRNVVGILILDVESGEYTQEIVTV